jgi:hypothetical protein
MRWETLLVPAVMASGFLAPPATAGPQGIELRDTYVAKMMGAGEVGGGGDLDGDGQSDAVTAYAAADPLGRADAGVAYVVLGPLRTRFAGLRSKDYRGFRILGAAANDNLSNSCIVGDLNDDGMDDVVLGAQSADTPNGAYSGAAYVVFGSTDRDDVDLADFHEGTQGDRGYRVDGAGGFDLAGFDVACLGDVNLDGVGDFAVAAPFAGATYVVFGKADTSTVDLRLFDLNAQVTSGFRIDTPVPEYNDGYSVGAAGDTNGDGMPDVVIGVIPRIYESPGDAYLVFGKSDPAPVDVSDGNGWGYRIRGARDGDATGYDVDGAGDFNGDGLDDVIVGARRIYRGLPGRAYVVFGSTIASDILLRALGERGVTMTGGPNRDSAGSAVAPAGDVDGDGYADVLVGAPWAHGLRRFVGTAYLVRGGPSTRPISLRELGQRGDGIYGARSGDEIGSSVNAYVDEASGKLRFLVGGHRHLKTYVVRPR